MLAALAFGLAAAPSTDALVSVFLDACIRGEVRLSVKQAVPVPYDEVPDEVRIDFYRDKNARFYALDKRTGDAYLAVSQFSPPTSKGWVSRCIVSGEFEAQQAWRKILRKLTGLEAPKMKKGAHYRHEMLMPSKRFRVIVTTWGMEAVLYDEKTASGIARKIKKPVRVESRETIW